MTEGSKKIKNNGVYIGLAVLIFFINAIKFLMDENSNLPVLNTLFGMSISLFILIFLIHKDITESRLNRGKGWIDPNNFR